MILMKDNPLKIEVLKKDTIMNISKESSFKKIYTFDFNKKDYGKITSYNVFPGIYLSHIELNTFDMDQFKSKHNSNDITINHCKKGRYECKFEGKYRYLEEGDLVAATNLAKNYYSAFPLGYYEGIEIFINTDLAKNSLKNIMGYSFDLDELHQKIVDNENFILIKDTEKIEHIFSELYYVDSEIQEVYFKLKLLELFLFLKITPLNNKLETKPHLSRKQVEVVKNIKNEIIQNINAPITLKELSKKYNISPSSLKTSFKIVYGKPLFAWRKEYRLQIAKRLLEESDENISIIGQKIGYTNPSKFSDAFKSFYNITPSEYRKKK